MNCDEDGPKAELENAADNMMPPSLFADMGLKLDEPIPT